MNDEQARKDLGRANYLAEEANVESRFIYRHREPGAIARVWQELHPQDTIIAEEQMPEAQEIHPQRTSVASTPCGQVMHLGT